MPASVQSDLNAFVDSAATFTVCATDRRGVVGFKNLLYDIVFYSTAQLDPTIGVSDSTVDGALVSIWSVSNGRPTSFHCAGQSTPTPPSAGVTIDANSGALTVGVAMVSAPESRPVRRNVLRGDYLDRPAGAFSYSEFVI